jgi:hypothetical protein
MENNEWVEGQVFYDRSMREAVAYGVKSSTYMVIRYHSKRHKLVRFNRDDKSWWKESTAEDLGEYKSRLAAQAACRLIVSAEE